jgi:hypothetical protein
VFFAVSFQDDVDKILANLILVELVDAKKQVKNAPSVQKSFGNEPMPEILLNHFPELKNSQQKPNNGLVGISLLFLPLFISFIQAVSLLEESRKSCHPSLGA